MELLPPSPLPKEIRVTTGSKVNVFKDLPSFGSNNLTIGVEIENPRVASLVFISPPPPYGEDGSIFPGVPAGLEYALVGEVVHLSFTFLGLLPGSSRINVWVHQPLFSMKTGVLLQSYIIKVKPTTKSAVQNKWFLLFLIISGLLMVIALTIYALKQSNVQFFVSDLPFSASNLKLIPPNKTPRSSFSFGE